MYIGAVWHWRALGVARRRAGALKIKTVSRGGPDLVFGARGPGLKELFFAIDEGVDVVGS